MVNIEFVLGYEAGHSTPKNIEDKLKVSHMQSSVLLADHKFRQTVTYYIEKWSSPNLLYNLPQKGTKGFTWRDASIMIEAEYNLLKHLLPSVLISWGDIWFCQSSVQKKSQSGEHSLKFQMGNYLNGRKK